MIITWQNRIDRYLQAIIPGASIPPKPIMHIAHSPTYFTKISKCFPYFVRCRSFWFPLFWPWCINASCFTRTGHACKHYP